MDLIDLKNMPLTNPDYVSRAVVEQIIWERDTAIWQLRQLGYGFGEKMRTDGDLISRQAAIDAVKEEWDGWSFEYDAETIVSYTCEALERLPSAQPEVLAHGEGELIAQPEPRWIPCSERLPEDLEEVNVTWVNHIPEPYYDFLKDKPFTGSAVYYRGEWFWYSSRCVDILAEYGVNDMDKVDDGVEITAWMPLPEPYKGEQE